MRRLGLVIAFSLASISAHAQVATPVLVRVYGEGAVRLRITDMRRHEACTEERERFLFDGRMSANQTTWLAYDWNQATKHGDDRLAPIGTTRKNISPG